MKKIYFIGINGIGMSGLAKIMKCKGYEVEGSDLSRSYVTDELESIGIAVHNEHSEKNLEGKNFDMIIASSAIKKENPEYIYALENGIKVVKREEQRTTYRSVQKKRHWSWIDDENSLS